MDMPPPLRKQPFLLCLLFNLFALPGLGTWMAGRKPLGLIQMAVSLLALLATAVPILAFYWSLMEQGFFRDVLQGKSLGNSTANLKLSFREFTFGLAALAAAGVFLANWAWSAFTAKTKKGSPPRP